MMWSKNRTKRKRLKLLVNVSASGNIVKPKPKFIAVRQSDPFVIILTVSLSKQPNTIRVPRRSEHLAEPHVVARRGTESTAARQAIVGFEIGSQMRLEYQSESISLHQISHVAEFSHLSSRDIRRNYPISFSGARLK